ncbi:MAG: DUF3467 domain-containing protein [Anaerolineales bacterium]|nr:DUF3467 domain-containing protein [Anaerolineales bacterium]
MPAQAKRPPVTGAMPVRVPENLEPTYSNLALITHSRSEIVMDFAQIMPQIRQALVKQRVIMSPINAKLFLRALQGNLDRYEEHFGAIELPEKPSLADQLFRPNPDAPPTDNSETPIEE